MTPKKGVIRKGGQPGRKGVIWARKGVIWARKGVIWAQKRVITAQNVGRFPHLFLRVFCVFPNQTRRHGVSFACLRPAALPSLRPSRASGAPTGGRFGTIGVPLSGTVLFSARFGASAGAVVLCGHTAARCHPLWRLSQHHAQSISQTVFLLSYPLRRQREILLGPSGSLLAGQRAGNPAISTAKPSGLQLLPQRPFRPSQGGVARDAVVGF
jgi:hypothetical protein